MIYETNPPRFTDHDGRTGQFKSPLVEEQMQELSDRIRALPDEIAALAKYAPTEDPIEEARRKV